MSIKLCCYLTLYLIILGNTAAYVTLLILIFPMWVTCCTTTCHDNDLQEGLLN